MTINVQVAFQGGGAKLVGLLAAADALEEAHNQGKIRITRVAGTSAGAIVALILASGTGVRRAKELLDSQEMRDAATTLSKPSNLLQLAALLKGKPLKSIDPLTTWLGKALQGTSSSVHDKKIEEICQMRSVNPMELLIVASDLTNRGSHVASPKESALKAVEASCGIPFAFRTWTNGGLDKVDGGLCANLPVDFLVGGEPNHGSVLAVSFERSIPKPHNSFLSYLLALIDTAISSGENRARESIPKENLFLISTYLTTFDFHKAVHQCLGDHYELIRGKAEKWLDKFTDLKNKQIQVLGIDPWRDQSENSKYALSQFGEYFSELEKGRSISYHYARMTVSAASLSEPANTNTGTTDFMRLELKFSAGDKPIHMMSMAIAEVDEHTFLDARTLRCFVSDASGKELKTTLMPMSLARSPLERNVAVCFHDPLPPNSGPYTLDYIIRGSKLLRSLQTSGNDIVAYIPSSTTESVETVELIVQIPEGLAIGRSYEGQAENQRWMQPRELRIDLPAGLTSFGCAASAVRAGDASTIWQLKLSMPTSQVT